MVDVARIISSNLNSKNYAAKPASMYKLFSSRQRQKSVLLFLTTSIIFSFLTFGKCEMINSIENNDKVNKEIHVGLDMEARTDTAEWGQDSMTTRRHVVTVNIVNPTPNLPELLSSSRSTKHPNRIWIVLAYRESCEQSMDLLRKLKYDAIPKIEFNYDVENDTSILRPEINFAPMPIDNSGMGVELKENILNRLRIFRLPSLFFLWDEEQEVESTLRLNNILATAEVYRGRSESIPDLVNGIYHYLTRLQLQTPLSSKKQEYHRIKHHDLPLTAVRVDSLQTLRNIVKNSDELKLFQRPLLPLDPDLSEDDDRWIRYLMDDSSGGMKTGLDNDAYHFGMNDRNIDHEKCEEESKDEMGSCRHHQSIRGYDYYVVIQCRNKMGQGIFDKNRDERIDSEAQGSNSQNSTVLLYQEFNQVAKVLGSRRDVLFSVLEPDIEKHNSSQLSPFCEFQSDDGLIQVWDFHSNDSHADIGHDEAKEKAIFGRFFNNSADVPNSLGLRLRPELMWFDRRMTAPIAFHPRYRRHAILFVDLHDRSSAAKTRDAIRSFRNECRQLKREKQTVMELPNSVLNQSVEGMVDDYVEENSFVCLVVPSTEIRVLNTFGLGYVWSYLDREATKQIRTTLCRSRTREGNNVPDNLLCDAREINQLSETSLNNDSRFSSILPTLLVTDRRKDGIIQRYYLDPPITPKSLREFIHEFIHGQIEPEQKSSHYGGVSSHAEDGNQTFPTNKHLVNLLSADSLPLFLEANRDKHVLVELYAPTCGHCKRFNHVWNSLGKLIDFLGWSKKLSVARIDVTSNEVIVPGMAATRLPDLFYFGIGVSENPIQYKDTRFADQVELGSISDPLDLLEWWMDEAGDAINEAELLHGLQ